MQWTALGRLKYLHGYPAAYTELVQELTGLPFHSPGYQSARTRGSTWSSEETVITNYTSGSFNRLSKQPCPVFFAKRGCLTRAR
jgi:hypothetical protein